MKNIITDLMKNTFVSIKLEGFSEVKGYIVTADEDDLLLKVIDLNGYDDGYAFFDINRIYRIDYGSAEELAIEKHYRERGIDKEVPIISHEKELLIDDVLYWAYVNQKPICVFFDDDREAVCGIIKDFNNMILQKIDLYECQGNQGYCTFDQDAAVYIQIDSRRARDSIMVSKEKGNFT